MPRFFSSLFGSRVRGSLYGVAARRLSVSAFGVCAASLSVAIGVATAFGGTDDRRVEFNRDIRPILADNCFACHGPDEHDRAADLRLDTQEGLHGGDGESGPVVPGDPASSELLRRVRSTDPLETMPPPESQKTLTPQQIELLEQWIAQGAEYQGHWSFMPIPPIAAEAAELGTAAAIDHYVGAALVTQGLAPAPVADRVTLLRRLSFDLTGLPPEPEEAAAFLADGSPEAYERVVDRLLASPHFGERLALWWLDLVRYADTVGYHGDQPMSVSPFRDYVIEAFNANMPFDRFTTEQLAGDLLPEPTRAQRIASGYNRLGMMSAEGGVQDKEYLAKYIAERVRNASGAWLGITLGCAECHDHKFDPLTTRDFYRFEAFFADIREQGLYAGANDTGQWGPAIPVPTPEQEAAQAELQRRLAELRDRLAAHAPEEETADPQVQAARDELAALEQRLKELQASFTVTLVTEAVAPRMVRVLPRGNWMDDSGEEVTPGFPAALAPATEPERRLSRRDLAAWILADENPLTARVTVNRLWKLFFGSGLSRKLDDVGAQGEWPSHPELLDYLAADFRTHGWDVKRLVKAIVMSRAYRQSSHADAAARETDPYNRWLARQGRFRLDAELVRDNALAVSGLLVRTVGGRSAFPYQPPGYWAYLNFPTREWQNSAGDGLYRRGLYTHWQRQYLHPSLLAFDAPTREECTADRPRSNTPLQSLVLLNDPTYVEAARALAELTLLQGGATPRARIDFAFLRALTRPATDAEAAVLERLLVAHAADYAADPAAAQALLGVGARPVSAATDPAELAAWTSVARTILNLHETITRN